MDNFKFEKRRNKKNKIKRKKLREIKETKLLETPRIGGEFIEVKNVEEFDGIEVNSPSYCIIC